LQPSMKPISNMKWDQRHLEHARLVASYSKDPSTKVGAVLVGEHHTIISVGYNGFPIGFPDRDEYYANRELKLRYICHAERNCLDLARCECRNSCLYCTLPPCSECAKSIVQKQIRRVVSAAPTQSQMERWGTSMDTAAFILKECKVELVFI